MSGVAEALLPLVADITTTAQTEERERIANAIRGSVSYGFELRPDGTEDPQAAAYVEGLHDAWAIARGDAT